MASSTLRMKLRTRERRDLLTAVRAAILRLREAGVDVQDIEIRRADLEDVFLRVMAHAGLEEGAL